MKAGHIVYTCKGSDSEGVWEGERRFNEFFRLAEKIEQRWPGIPIPQLPPKKAIGNKDIKFINERRYYLERFLKKISTFPFVVNSKEFGVFSRPNGDIEKVLKGVAKPSYSETVDKYREVLSIEDHLYDPVQKDKLDTESKEFHHFSKQALPIL